MAGVGTYNFVRRRVREARKIFLIFVFFFGCLANPGTYLRYLRLNLNLDLSRRLAVKAAFVLRLGKIISVKELLIG